MKTEVIKAAKNRMQRMALVRGGDDSLFVSGQKLPLTEVAKMREQIAGTLSSEEMIYPLGMLVDKKKLSHMDEEAKMRYLLDMCAIYVKLKNSMK